MLKFFVCISNKSVLKFASQVARAMAHLEEKGMVHKDLATRYVCFSTYTIISIHMVLFNTNSCYCAKYAFM